MEITGPYSQRIQEVLFSDTYIKAIHEGFAKFGFSAEEGKFISDILNKVYSQEIKIDKVYDNLDQKLKREPKELKKIEKHLYMYCFSFFDDIFYVNLEEKFVELGGDKNEYQSIRGKFSVDLYNEIIEEQQKKLAEVMEADSDIIEENRERRKMKENYTKLVTIENLEQEKTKYKKVLKTRLKEALTTDDWLELAVNNHRLIYTLLNSDVVYFNEVKQIVLENSEILTQVNVSKAGTETVGTVSNWLSDFYEFNDNEKIDSMSIARYLASSLNAVKLDESDRTIIMKLLDFHKMLNGLPHTLKDIPTDKWYLFPVPEIDIDELFGEKKEDEKPKTEKDVTEKKTFNQGHKKTIQRDSRFHGNDSKMTSEEIAKKYVGDEQENKKITEVVQKINKLTGQSPKQLIDILLKTVSGNKIDTITVIAILKIIAETDNFAVVLKDEKIKKLVFDYTKNNGIPMDKEYNLENNISKYTTYLIRMVLETKIGLNVDQSARIGLQLSNVGKRIKSKITNLARFNLETSKFEWV